MGCPKLQTSDYFRFVDPDEAAKYTPQKNRYKANFHTVISNYRYYSPELGRWLSRDPIQEQGGENLYGMVTNDPVNEWDYLGNITWTDEKKMPEETKKAILCILRELGVISKSSLTDWTYLPPIYRQLKFLMEEDKVYEGQHPDDPENVLGQANVWTGSSFIKEDMDWGNKAAQAMHEATHHNFEMGWWLDAIGTTKRVEDKVLDLIEDARNELVATTTCCKSDGNNVRHANVRIFRWDFILMKCVGIDKPYCPSESWTFERIDYE